MNQLNIYSPTSLYEAFPPAEARRAMNKREINRTPQHGSWLNMAETELSVYRHDLPERVASKATLGRHAAAWQHRRNATAIKTDWRFTTADAHIKLRKTLRVSLVLTNPYLLFYRIGLGCL